MGLRQTGRACLRWTRAVITSLARGRTKKCSRFIGGSKLTKMPEEISAFDEQFNQIYLATGMCCCCCDPASEDHPVIQACKEDDKFCQECLTTLFRRAIKQPATEMPPRCCGIIIPLALGFQFLTTEEIDVFKILFEGHTRHRQTFFEVVQLPHLHPALQIWPSGRLGNYRRRRQNF